MEEYVEDALRLKEIFEREGISEFRRMDDYMAERKYASERNHDGRTHETEKTM